MSGATGLRPERADAGSSERMKARADDEQQRRRCAHCRAPISHRRPNARFCGARCSSGAWYAQWRADNPLPALSERQCARCAERFAPRRSTQRYCSDRCRACATTARYRERHPNAPKPARACAWCGVSLPSERRSDTKYCGPLCAGRARWPRSARYRRTHADKKLRAIGRASSPTHGTDA